MSGWVVNSNAIHQNPRKRKSPNPREQDSQKRQNTVKRLTERPIFNQGETIIKPGDIYNTLIGIHDGDTYQISENHYAQINITEGLRKAGLVCVGNHLPTGDYLGIPLVLTNTNRFKPIKIFEGDQLGAIQINEKPQYHATNKARVRKKQIKAPENKQEETGSKTDYKFGKNLNEEQKNQLQQILSEYQDVTAAGFEDIQTKENRFFHDVDTTDAKPIKQRPYRTPYHLRPWVNQEIQQMLASGIIRKSKSPWASPITIVAKKSDEPEIYHPRMCVDFRKINEATKTTGFPVPRIDKILESMEGNPQYFTSLDLFMGYYQIKLTPRAVERSAFVTEDGAMGVSQNAIWNVQRASHIPASHARYI